MIGLLSEVELKANDMATIHFHMTNNLMTLIHGIVNLEIIVRDDFGKISNHSLAAKTMIIILHRIEIFMTNLTMRNTKILRANGKPSLEIEYFKIDIGILTKIIIPEMVIIKDIIIMTKIIGIINVLNMKELLRIRNIIKKNMIAISLSEVENKNKKKPKGIIKDTEKILWPITGSRKQKQKEAKRNNQRYREDPMA